MEVVGEGPHQKKCRNKKIQFPLSWALEVPKCEGSCSIGLLTTCKNQPKEGLEVGASSLAPRLNSRAGQVKVAGAL